MIWLLLIVMAAITFFNRYLFLAKSISYSPGVKLKRFLSYSSYAVLTAIWAPIVFEYDGMGVSASHFSIAGYDYLVATIIAATLSFMRANSLMVVLCSSGVFFAIRFLM